VFALYVPGLDRQAALDRARQIVARFAQTFGTGDRERIQRVSVTASVGVSVLPDDAVTVDELFARAEAAVDLAKRAGRNRVIPYFRGCTLPVPRLL
jgi:GGDEF domain-containing protein